MENGYITALFEHGISVYSPANAQPFRSCNLQRKFIAQTNKIHQIAKSQAMICSNIRLSLQIDMRAEICIFCVQGGAYYYYSHALFKSSMRNNPDQQYPKADYEKQTFIQWFQRNFWIYHNSVQYLPLQILIYNFVQYFSIFILNL